MKTPTSRRVRLVVLLAAAVAAAAASAQTPKFANARVENHAVASLDRDFKALVAAQSGPAWIAYSVPMVAGRHQMCGNHVHLESTRGDAYDSGVNYLEGPTNLFIFVRAENHIVDKMRTLSDECQIDAGGLAVHWLTGVRPEESVALLSSYLDAMQERNKSDAPISAIALHNTPAADAALDRFAAAGQPESRRMQAVFWMGVARGRRGYEAVKKIAESDSSDKVRERAIFALTQSKEPEAVDAIIAVARNDRSIHVRGQALFWLGQKAGRKATDAIKDAIESDPDTEVKKKAVFALSQLPKDEGIPLLIQVAKTNRNPEVKKQAFFWLGQSKDPRALAFFTEVLAR
jgi:HEAT repeat protein